MENKKLGEKTAIGMLVMVIIVLFALLFASVLNLGAKTEEEWVKGFENGIAYERSITPKYRDPLELDPFLEYVDYKIMYVLNVEPVFIIDMPDINFVSVVYNVSYYNLAKEEINGSVEIWSHNHSMITKYMVFDSAFGNGQNPVSEKTLIDIYYLRHTRDYYSVIYYEKIV